MPNVLPLRAVSVQVANLWVFQRVHELHVWIWGVACFEDVPLSPIVVRHVLLVVVRIASSGFRSHPTPISCGPGAARRWCPRHWRPCRYVVALLVPILRKLEW